MQSRICATKKAPSQRKQLPPQESRPVDARWRAIAALQKLLSIPSTGVLAENIPLTPALLRLDPMFDPLRSDPRFQKLAGK
jgi:hypothetical protein